MLTKVMDGDPKDDQPRGEREAPTEMVASASFDPTLSPDEIYRITHYKRPSEQLRALAELGIPAHRRHDNTVCVLRAHATNPPKAEPSRPKLKL